MYQKYYTSQHKISSKLLLFQEVVEWRTFKRQFINFNPLNEYFYKAHKCKEIKRLKFAEAFMHQKFTHILSSSICGTNDNF